ncbi:hypothetical protein [Rhodococcus qingshengii]|uniref:hypothetical protein n=1 Tax=Rhodococcus qingshengii TaxID=334542 RepID=UPI001ADFF854|nr:hypothetical protein [Rhodococcus qingshengii]
MNKAPALIVDALDAASGVYGTLADFAGHLPVRDRYRHLWVLVEVAGRLLSRRAFVRDAPQVKDSPDIYGPIDIDSRAVLSTRCAMIAPRAVDATGLESLA